MHDPCLVIACGALAREIQYLKVKNAWHHMTLECLDASLHNTPIKIPGLIAAKLEKAAQHYRRILIAYGDCGTNGAIDRLIDDLDHVERLPGPHCFATFAGLEAFQHLSAAEPGIFWLTDFLVRHFETMVVKSLKLDSHPELLPLYFGHYTQARYLSQQEDDVLLCQAQAAADFLGLTLHHQPVGLDALAEPLTWCAA